MSLRLGGTVQLVSQRGTRHGSQMRIRGLQGGSKLTMTPRTDGYDGLVGHSLCGESDEAFQLIDALSALPKPPHPHAVAHPIAHPIAQSVPVEIPELDGCLECTVLAERAPDAVICRRRTSRARRACRQRQRMPSTRSNSRRAECAGRWSCTSDVQRIIAGIIRATDLEGDFRIRHQRCRIQRGGIQHQRHRIQPHWI